MVTKCTTKRAGKENEEGIAVDGASTSFLNIHENFW